MSQDLTIIQHRNWVILKENDVPCAVRSYRGDAQGAAHSERPGAGHVTYRASTALLGLFLALFVSSCVSGPEMPTGPIKFQCYDQATGKWEDCPEILDEDMKCHEMEQPKDQA
jgi:hypothetical protein